MAMLAPPQSLDVLKIPQSLVLFFFSLASLHDVNAIQ